jgi:hypothetical protein
MLANSIFVWEAVSVYTSWFPIYSVLSCAVKVLSRRRGHAEAAVCEGLLQPDDSAGIDTQQHGCSYRPTASHFCAGCLAFPGAIPGVRRFRCLSQTGLLNAQMRRAHRLFLFDYSPLVRALGSRRTTNARRREWQKCGREARVARKKAGK